MTPTSWIFILLQMTENTAYCIPSETYTAGNYSSYKCSFIISLALHFIGSNVQFSFQGKENNQVTAVIQVFRRWGQPSSGVYPNNSFPFHNHSDILPSGSWGGWSRDQLTLSKGRITQWPSHQFITGSHQEDNSTLTLKLTPMKNLELPVSLMRTSVDGGREPTQTQDSTQTLFRKAPGLGINPLLCCCEMATIVHHCYVVMCHVTVLVK